MDPITNEGFCEITKFNVCYHSHAAEDDGALLILFNLNNDIILKP